MNYFVSVSLDSTAGDVITCVIGEGWNCFDLHRSDCGAYERLVIDFSRLSNSASLSKSKYHPYEMEAAYEITGDLRRSFISTLVRWTVDHMNS